MNAIMAATRARILTRVPFHGGEVLAIEGATPDDAMIVLPPIVERLGLDWSAQLKRIKRQPVLNEGLAIMAIPSAGGAQDMVCLPLSRVNFWLATISTQRISNPAVRETILTYQRERAKVLYQHFRGKAASLGDYQVSALPNFADPDVLLPMLADYARARKELSAQVGTLTTEVGRLQPKAEALDRISAARGDQTLTETAKGLTIHRDPLIKWMLAEKLLYRLGHRSQGRLVAYQPAIDRGLLSQNERFIEDTGRMMPEVRVTPKGVTWLAEHLPPELICRPKLRLSPSASVGQPGLPWGEGRPH